MTNKLSRNDPCWCGSGKKYKHCHFKSDMLGLTAPGSAGHPQRPDIIIKTPEQIEGIRRSCQLTRRILDEITPRIAPGITTDDINRWVHELTVAAGAIPAPLHYRGFPKSVCTSLNEVICHGIPGDRLLVEGDILNVDVTSILDGYYGDASRMFLVGEVAPEARRLVEVTRECLELGIAQVRPGNTTGDIGHVIQQHAESQGYSVVRMFVGHGVGVHFHEPPDIAHYGHPHTGVSLVPGMIFTIEPMINIGTYEVVILDDGWTALTADGSLSAQWEHTVLVTADGVEVLTA
ncbi:MAG TPA: methionyl aminopeptidase [Anaerolineae bacterium]|nr:methionyl aminopeptidase [Anaerolineae bacterium]